MRGDDRQESEMFLYGSVDAALESMSGRFDEMYAKGGRPSIAPERLLRALLLQAHGQESRLAYLGHVMMDNRHGLAIDTLLTEANGRAERDAALAVAAHLPGRNKRVTLGADKGYDTLDFVKGLRQYAVTPHVAQNISGRSSRIDERTTRHHGYRHSQRKRKLVEQVFGWIKTTAGLRQTKHCGRERVSWMFTFAAAAYNLIRVRNIMEAAI